MAVRQSDRRGWCYTSQPVGGRRARRHIPELLQRRRQTTITILFPIDMSTTPEAQCWACAKPTSMRYSIPAAGARRPPCSETSSRPRHCADFLSLGGGKRHGRRVSRAPTGGAASRPHRQLALACDRRADAFGLVCFYGNQTLGSGHGINTGLRVRPHSGGGGLRWPASLERGAIVNNQAASCGEGWHVSEL